MDVRLGSDQQYVFVPNYFPYLLDEDIGHYCIFATCVSCELSRNWFNVCTRFDISDTSVRNICESICEPDNDYVTFRHDVNFLPVNGGHLYTIHVFVHRKDETHLPPLVRTDSSKREEIHTPQLVRSSSVNIKSTMTWDRLLSESQSPGGLAALSQEFTRKPEVSAAYEAAREERIRNYANLGAKILICDLGLEGFVSEDGRFVDE